MGRIKARSYKKCYTINLLPKVIAPEQYTYYIDRRETKGYYHIMVRFLRSLNLKREVLADMITRLKNLEQMGGLLLTYEIHRIPNVVFHEKDWVELDLNYLAEKHVRLEVTGMDVTEIMLTKKSFQKTFNDILCGVYSAYDNVLNINKMDEPFIEELFLQDDVDMSVNEKSEFVINVDSSLRDFLLDLNQKLQ